MTVVTLELYGGSVFVLSAIYHQLHIFYNTESKLIINHINAEYGAS
jgi:hypothetical protein